MVGSIVIIELLPEGCEENVKVCPKKYKMHQVQQYNECIPSMCCVPLIPLMIAYLPQNCKMLSKEFP